MMKSPQAPWHPRRTLEYSRKRRRALTHGFHSALNCICDLCWIFSARILSRFSVTLLPSYAGNPRLHRPVCSQDHFQESCVCPEWGLPWAQAQASYPEPHHKGPLGPPARGQTVAAAFTWAFAGSSEPFYPVRYRMPSPPLASKRTWPWRNTSHTSDAREVEDETETAGGDWTLR